MDSFKIIKPFLYNHKITLLIYTIFILLTHPLESIIIPNLFSSLFKSLKENISNDILFNFFKNIGILMMITNISQIICSKIDSYMMPRFNEYVTNYLFEKILYFYEDNYADLELGKILARLNALPTILRELSTDLFNWVIPKLFTIIIINFYFFYYDTTLGLISFMFIISLGYYNFNKYKKCIDLSTAKYLSLENKAESIQDKLSNLYSIFSSSKVNDEITDFKKISESFRQDQENALLCSNKLKNNNNVATLIFFIIVLSYIAYIFNNNKIDQETLVKLYMILMTYVPCLNTIVIYLPDYTNHMGILYSINNYVKLINIDNSKKPDIIISEGKIDVTNLTFGYTKEKNIFDNFNLLINSNQKISIIGPSGNGKSTLIKLIMGYFKVPNNTIFIDNQDINKYNLCSLRKQISFINQNTKLFNKSIYENIQYGTNLSKAEIDKLIQKYNLSLVFNNINGFNTNVGVNGDSLSGGQKQIIQLLRCYKKNNKIIILDEPTSALDDNTKVIINNIIKKISKNSTLIIITHDTSNLDLSDTTIKIQNGQII